MGAYLFALGLVLRATALGLPFVRDQDVQRVLTGALPIGEILFGRGLSDRHPPLWFLVLHVVELAGQSPSIVRAPAVLTGACIGPAIVWAARERAGAGLSRMAAVLATLATVSSSLVASSREVSEIPFFTLVVIATVALLARADRAPTTINLAALATAHALVLSTYHLGVFVLAGLWLGRVVWRLEDARHSQRVRRAALVGVLLGLPALALAAHTFTVDLGAREAATLHPDRAWGEASVLGMFGASTTTTTDAIGVGTLLVALAFAIVDRACRPTTLAALVTLVGIALLAPVARVQPYYALTVAPLWLASIACTDRSSWTAPRRAAAAAAIAIAALVPIAIAFPALGALYTADADAVFGRYVLDAQRAHVDRIVAVAHYDATLLAYEEAQASSRRLDSSALDADAEGTLSAASTPRIAFLTRSHGEPQSSAESAAGRLRHFASRETIAVVVRDAFPMPEVDRLLEHCARLDASATTRLVLCDRDSFR